MKVMKKEDILQHTALKRELVDVPEWEGQVWVQELPASARDDYEQSLTRTIGSGRNATIKTNFKNHKAKFCAQCIVDETGERIFGDADIEQLGKLGSAAINRVFEVGQRLSGMSPKDLEELEENLSGTPAGDSHSD